MNREHFDNALKELEQDVDSMILMTHDILFAAVKALEEQDYEAAKQIYKMDDKIDALMNTTEEKCVELIALQQPKAKDLRTLFAIIKIITDLERMGDYCVNIAREIKLLGKENIMPESKNIFRMKDVIGDMILEARKSYLEGDVKLAKSVGEDDELVDTLFNELYNAIMMRILEDKTYINQGTKLLFIGRFMERIADHLTNVCEKIIYIQNGQMVEIN